MKKVLVAVDDSVRAGAVFDAAAELARLLDAELYLFRAARLPPEFPPAAASSKPDLLPDHLAEVGIHELRRLAERSPQTEVAKFIVSFGETSQKILEMADSLDVDFIVLGSHGYRGGGTASSVPRPRRSRISPPATC